MQKTILLIRNAYVHDFGGGERVPVNIGHELMANGYRPIVVSRSPKLLNFAQETGVPSIRGWWWSRQDWSGRKVLLVPIYLLWQIILTAWYLGLIIRTSADIVHPQSKDDFIAATMAAKLLGKKVVWSDYADLKYVYQNHRVWYKNPISKIVWFLSRFAAHILLTSESDRRLIETSIKQKLPSQYTIVHYGVKSGDISPISRTHEDASATIFVATSRLVTAKGIGELITAFNEVHKAHPDTRLWLFGEGPEAEHFKQMAEANNHIIFWGFPDDTLSHVASCDVFVHPSYLEGFSISLVEAAKLGLPIIACNVGGNPELVSDGKNGILVPARDAKSLAQAMELLASDDSLRKSYGRTARKTYESRLIFENIVKDVIIPLYEK